MAKELATLIRLAKLQLDEKRKVLAAILSEEDRVKAEKAALLQRLAQETQSTASDFAAELSRGHFIRATLKKRDQYDKQLAELLKIIEMAQEEVAKAFEEVKRYEIAEEAQQRREAKEQQRRDTKALDEIGSTRYQRDRQDE